MFWKSDQGLGVARTEQYGPASSAGIQGLKMQRKVVRVGNQLFESVQPDKNSADKILAINNIEIGSTDDLQEVLDRFKPGDVVNVTIMRQQQKLTIPVTLGLER